MAKSLKTTPYTPEQTKPNHTVVPPTPKKKRKKRKKKKQSYKEMMASITQSNMTQAEKIAEKKEALNTPSVEPAKLVTI